jgi:hypothetical protein
MNKKGRPKRDDAQYTHYWRPEIQPLLVAAVLVYIAVNQSPEARRIYQQIMDEWGRPDCQALLKEIIVLPVAQYKEWRKAAAENREYNSELEIWMGLYEKYRESDDFKNLFGLIGEFIEAGFNRQKDLIQGKLTVTASRAAYLNFAVVMLIAGSYLEKHPELDGKTRFKFDGIVLEVSVLYGEGDERVHRLHSKLFKGLAYQLSHDDKLKMVAWRWYQCRVVYSGPEEFCIKSQLEGIDLDPANVSKEVLLGDIATGYPRKSSPNKSLD